LSAAVLLDALGVAVIVGASLWVLRRRLMRPACGDPPRSHETTVRKRTDELGIGRRLEDAHRGSNR
jgi:hypothetical protein